MATPRLGAPELVSAQATPETTVNEIVRYLEAFATRAIVKDRDLATPPGSPADGDAYLVAGSPTGAWTGQAAKIAIYINTAWVFVAVKEGFEIEVEDEDEAFTYRGGTWVASDTGGGGGGGGAWQLQWSPLMNEPPTSNPATIDTRNSRPCLDFDTTTQETAIFSGVLPADYGGGGVTVSLYVAMTSATSGTVGFDLAFERTDASSLDIDSDSFASAVTVTATTVPGTSGQVLKLDTNISNGANMDSLAAGELFRLRIRRDVSNDTAAGDAELLFVMMVEQ